MWCYVWKFHLNDNPSGSTVDSNVFGKIIGNKKEQTVSMPMHGWEVFFLLDHCRLNFLAVPTSFISLVTSHPWSSTGRQQISSVDFPAWLLRFLREKSEKGSRTFFGLLYICDFTISPGQCLVLTSNPCLCNQWSHRAGTERPGGLGQGTGKSPSSKHGLARTVAPEH